MFCLLVHVHDQLRTVDAFRKARKIFDQSRGGKLATGVDPRRPWGTAALHAGLSADRGRRRGHVLALRLRPVRFIPGDGQVTADVDQLSGALPVATASYLRVPGPRPLAMTGSPVRSRSPAPVQTKVASALALAALARNDARLCNCAPRLCFFRDQFHGSRPRQSSRFRKVPVLGKSQCSFVVSRGPLGFLASVRAPSPSNSATAPVVCASNSRRGLE